MIVCGDQVRDVGEDCDTGEANGLVACCTADCVLDDPDGDHICSELDSCPDVYNYDQSQSVCRPLSFDVTKLKAKAARRLPDIDDSRVLFKGLLNGDGIAVIESIDAIRIQDASAYDHTVSGFVCSGDGSRMLCETTDRIASARIRATSSAVKLKVKLRAADIPGGSLIAPLTVSLTDNFGMTRADSVPYCDGCTF